MHVYARLTYIIISISLYMYLYNYRDSAAVESTSGVSITLAPIIYMYIVSGYSIQSYIRTADQHVLYQNHIHRLVKNRKKYV